MPARVEFRLGSIFDEPCDLLVIPSSHGGAVTRELRAEIRRLGLPFPSELTHGKLSWGSIAWGKSPVPRYRYVAFAAAVMEQSISAFAIGDIARQLRELAGLLGLTSISAPLFGTESDGRMFTECVEVLASDFSNFAPEGSVLTISVHEADKLLSLARLLPETVGANLRVEPAATSKAWQAVHTASDGAAHGITTALVSLESPVKTGAQPELPADSNVASSDRRGVFISYSHADAEWLERLQKHLRPLQRQGVDVWDDTRLRAGERWREEIREALAATKVAILLISADFLASDFIVTNELPPLLKAAEEDGATILPLIISPCRFTRMESLSRFQAVNDPAKPLVQMRRANREKVLDDVTRAVEDALKR
jgi:nucleotide-binding universal stress UspA family protein